MSSTFTPNELKLFTSVIQSIETYLEFGAGETTRIVSTLPNLKIGYSFEGDINWYNSIKKEIDNNKIKINYLDIGKVKDWSYPTEDNLYKYLNYSLKFISFLNPNIKFDFIFIDGRFRVATFILSSLFLNNTGIIGIHDYSLRCQYSIIDTYFNFISREDSLYLFKPIKDNTLDLINLLPGYLFDPR